MITSFDRLAASALYTYLADNTVSDWQVHQTSSVAELEQR
jgi:hypothetical protein